MIINFTFRDPSYYTDRVAESLGCKDKASIVECLQTAPLDKLLDYTYQFDQCNVRSDLKISYPTPWIPTVDRWAPTSFLPGTPKELTSEGGVARVPILVGFNKDEGLLLTTRFIKEPDFMEHCLKNMNTCGPINLFGIREEDITEEHISETHRLIEAYGAVQEGKLHLRQFRDLAGDAVMALDTHTFTELLKRQGYSVYRYTFLQGY